MKIYGIVSSQVLTTSMGDIIGLNHSSVKAVIEIYCEEDKREWMFENMLLCDYISRNLDKKPVDPSEEE